MKTIAGAAAASVLTIFALASAQAEAASSSAGCGIQQASELALQRRLAVIDAAKVNTPDFFSGANSCISPDLLRSFDLSSLIPDLAGFLSGGVQGLAQQALNAAKSQVCEVINGQINKVIGQINGATGQFQTSIGGNLASLFGNSGTMSAPSLPNFGNYSFPDMSSVNLGNFVSAGSSQFGSASPTGIIPSTMSAVPVVTSSPATVEPEVETDPVEAPASSGSSWLQ